MSRLTRDGTAEPVSRDQILRHARGQGNIFPCSADHEQDWQPYPVDPYSAICDDHTYIHTYTAHMALDLDYKWVEPGTLLTDTSRNTETRSVLFRGSRVSPLYPGDDVLAEKKLSNKHSTRS